MHYRAKHPDGIAPDPVIVDAIEAVAEDGRLTCSNAMALAQKLDVSPAEVGRNMDLIECRITECQLGIFGFEPEKKILRPADAISDQLRDSLLSTSSDGSISCAACWLAADALGMQKIAIAAACELLGLKIRPCQLGAF